MSTIAFVTYRDLPQLTSEDQLVCSFLQRYGVQTQAVIWDAPDVVWNMYEAVVVRSCWDYHLHPSTFFAWLSDLERLQVRLWNPASCVGAIWPTAQHGMPADRFAPDRSFLT